MGNDLTQIFISHSRRDGRQLGYFDNIFAGTTLRAYRSEFESLGKPPSSELQAQIVNSAAVFVLLSPYVTDSKHTQSWVAWETGVANQAGKGVWVFEEAGQWVDFPIPAPQHYVVYDSGNATDRDAIKKIVEAHVGDPTPAIAGIVLGGILGALMGRAAHKQGWIPGAIIGGALGGAASTLAGSPIQGLAIQCPYKNCRSSYTIHIYRKRFRCPACRQEIVLEKS